MITGSVLLIILSLTFSATFAMNQVALVTGANRGIGKEVCRQLAAQGYQVLLGSRSLEKGEATVNELGLSGITPLQIDVTDESSVSSAKVYIEKKYGVLDVLVNNAGINYDSWQQTTSADLANVRETMETNLYGPWRCTMTFLPLLNKSSHPRVVNVSSGSGSLDGMSGSTPAYGISKAALNALTIKLSKELPNMRVNAVCPGWIATDMGGAGGGPIEQGGASVVWAATLNKNGPTGGFFRNGKRISW